METKLKDFLKSKNVILENNESSEETFTIKRSVLEKIYELSYWKTINDAHECQDKIEDIHNILSENFSFLKDLDSEL